MPTTFLTTKFSTKMFPPKETKLTLVSAHTMEVNQILDELEDLLVERREQDPAFDPDKELKPWFAAINPRLERWLAEFLDRDLPPSVKKFRLREGDRVIVCQCSHPMPNGSAPSLPRGAFFTFTIITVDSIDKEN